MGITTLREVIRNGGEGRPSDAKEHAGASDTPASPAAAVPPAATPPSPARDIVGQKVCHLTLRFIVIYHTHAFCASLTAAVRHTFLCGSCY